MFFVSMWFMDLPVRRTMFAKCSCSPIHCSNNPPQTHPAPQPLHSPAQLELGCSCKLSSTLRHAIEIVQLLATCSFLNRTDRTPADGPSRPAGRPAHSGTAGARRVADTVGGRSTAGARGVVVLTDRKLDGRRLSLVGGCKLVCEGH
jgi:hypothetical protein